MGRRAGLVALLAALALTAAAAAAQAEALIPLNDATFSSSHPIYATAPPDDGRLFVVQRGGQIRVLSGGTLKTFLTVPNVDSTGERGLLSMAFPPDYGTTGLFYVFTVANGPDPVDAGAVDGDLQIIEYHVSADPDVADPNSGRLVLKQPHSATNHNGGQLLFGPDNLLYIDFGDGASSSNAQDSRNMLGHLLRIEPRQQGSSPYGIPGDNPFAGNPRCSPTTLGGTSCPEIFSSGVRNPFRASFDRLNGDWIVGDVGENTWEEVDVGRHIGGIPGDNTLRGANLGWPTCEGACSNPAFVNPLFQYGHASSGTTTGCAVIGGFVVHDPALANLNGRYLYGDLCRTDLRTLNVGVSGGDPKPANLNLTSSGSLYSFGEDSGGCVYVAADSKLYRVAASGSEPFACPNAVSAQWAGIAGGTAGTGGGGSGGGSGSGSATESLTGTGPAPGPSALPVTLSLSVAGARSGRLGKTVNVSATCDLACDITATGTLSFSPGSAASNRLRSARAHAAAGQRVTLKLRLSKKQLSRAKRVARRGGKVTARVVVIARDAAGTTSRATTRIRLR
jgi:glucose/arabinose dehydrogenase